MKTKSERLREGERERERERETKETYKTVDSYLVDGD
jgi:hypothetical protein